jgi:hypothetical protein
MRFTRPAIAFVLAAAALPGVTRAEDAKPTTLTADFGYVQTTGNSEVTTVSGTDKLAHRAGPWLYTQEAGAVWGETEGVESPGATGSACASTAVSTSGCPPTVSPRGGGTRSRASRASSTRESGSRGTR